MHRQITVDYASRAFWNRDRLQGSLGYAGLQTEETNYEYLFNSHVSRTHVATDMMRDMSKEYI